MAPRSVIPDPLKRRHLVEEELEPARALVIGEAYLAEGRLCEAVEFLAKAQARERLEALRDQAVALGDPFLLRAACTALGEDPGRARWTATAEAARAAGKEVQARDAERHAQLAPEAAR